MLTNIFNLFADNDRPDLFYGFAGLVFVGGFKESSLKLHYVGQQHNATHLSLLGCQYPARSGTSSPAC